jgi:hypothetical protein
MVSTNLCHASATFATDEETVAPSGPLFAEPLFIGGRDAHIPPSGKSSTAACVAQNVSTERNEQQLKHSHY